MIEVDARGLSCPEPVMLTMDAMKAEKGSIRVLVDEPHQKINVEKCVSRAGRKSAAKELDGFFEIIIE